MSKHTNWKTKYNYVMRYLNGESATKIGIELKEKGLTKNKDTNKVIYEWVYQYKNGGIDGLVSKTGLKATGRPPKKPKEGEERFEGWTREQIIKHIEGLEEWIENHDSNKKSMYKYIDSHTYISKAMLCKELGVSRSGYYNWIKLGKKECGNYDEKLLEQIKFLFYIRKQKFGFRRIKVMLEREFNVFVNINTVRRYMLHMGLKSNIRQKKKMQEVKITNRTFEDLIKRKWNVKKPYRKLFTDVSYIKTKNGWSYLSVVLDSFNNEILSWEFSRHNNNFFVFQNIKNSLFKIDDYNHTIIHSDHGYQYFQEGLSTLRNKLGFKQSMGRLGISLDNRPVEYFFSVLKQEYLFDKTLDYEKTRDLISSSIYDYNNKRFQSCLENKTPIEYKLDRC